MATRQTITQERDNERLGKVPIKLAQAETDVKKLMTDINKSGHEDRYTRQRAAEALSRYYANNGKVAEVKALLKKFPDRYVRSGIFFGLESAAKEDKKDLSGFKTVLDNAVFGESPEVSRTAAARALGAHYLYGIKSEEAFLQAYRRALEKNDVDAIGGFKDAHLTYLEKQK